MDEKTMVNDILENVKSKLTCYQNAITESGNIELRQTLKQLRDNLEIFQYELFKVACSKNYYIPAPTADAKEVQKIKNEIDNE